MIVAGVLARLREAAMPPLRLVEGAGEFAALKAPPPESRMPAAYVVPLGSAAGPNGLATGGIRQAVTETVGVILLHRSLRDARAGQATLELAEQVIPAVRAALVGWRPDGAATPLLLAQAGLVDITDGVLAWQESFSATVTLRAG